MTIRQVSIFIENATGRLYDVIRLLGDNEINLRALSLADTSDFGIVRIIVDEPEAVRDLLKKHNYTVGINDVIAIKILNTPGGLADVLQELVAHSINVEYMYAFVTNCGEDAIMVFRFDDTANAYEVLKKSSLELVDEKSLFSI